ncbi:molecular chaperone DnaJ [Glaciihabitans arcticus]|uniref:Molecular chaperone DnaJ n=1 Tax=Glaciihabitans arcticus TaxID=2668039 RepID=A0A4Q9GSQ6_9MICO|nr:DnaJ domain-containing protein [Glaciihabitans arcticus]TBN56648.1 molecular chaperone DnaJ [Glaciihabitans arcticus]
MMASPLSASPYEILGVTPSATNDELRRAYRARLRASHPDTGGEASEFHAVQAAWELVGTPEARASYDRQGGTSPGETFAARPARASTTSRPQARSYGHPGGWRREKYLGLMREWVGRGVDLPDPYDPSLVRSAPRDIRHVLSDALAEEATARSLSDLGIAYTIWHDVATAEGSTSYAPGDDASKLDHIVLGPTGLFGVLSEDWAAPVRIKRGELIGEGLLDGERPFHSLATRAKVIARAAKVRFTALVIVIPDDAFPDSLTEVGKVRGYPAVLVHRSRLAGLMRSGIDNDDPVGGNELFDARTRLQSTVRFV